jgi:hypothetical protein
VHSKLGELALIGELNSAIRKTLTALKSKGKAMSPSIVYIGATIESNISGIEPETDAIIEFRALILKLLEFNTIVVAPSGNTRRIDLGNEDKLSSKVNILNDYFGKNTKLHLPGRIVLTSASDFCNTVAFFSKKYADEHNVVWVAPGEKIQSTLPGNEYGFMSGTSQASAQLAVLFSVLSHKFSSSGTTAANLIDFVRNSSRNIDSSNFKAILPFAMNEDALIH